MTFTHCRHACCQDEDRYAYSGEIVGEEQVSSTGWATGRLLPPISKRIHGRTPDGKNGTGHRQMGTLRVNLSVKIDFCFPDMKLRGRFRREQTRENAGKGVNLSEPPSSTGTVQDSTINIIDTGQLYTHLIGRGISHCNFPVHTSSEELYQRHNNILE